MEKLLFFKKLIYITRVIFSLGSVMVSTSWWYEIISFNDVQYIFCGETC